MAPSPTVAVAHPNVLGLRGVGEANPSIALVRASTSISADSLGDNLQSAEEAWAAWAAELGRERAALAARWTKVGHGALAVVLAGLALPHLAPILLGFARPHFDVHFEGLRSAQLDLAGVRPGGIPGHSSASYTVRHVGLDIVRALALSLALGGGGGGGVDWRMVLEWLAAVGWRFAAGLALIGPFAAALARQASAHERTERASHS